MIPVFAPTLFIPTAVAAGVTYATWDPATKNAGITLSGGDLVAAAGASLISCRSTLGKAAGKWYWELTATSIDPSSGWGVVDGATYDNTQYPGLYGNSASSLAANNNFISGTFSNGAAITFFAIANGDVIGFAMDASTGQIWVHKNGSYQPNDPTGAEHWLGAGYTLYATIGPYNGTITANFGATAFAYSVPSGFNAGLYI